MAMRNAAIIPIRNPGFFLTSWNVLTSIHRIESTFERLTGRETMKRLWTLVVGLAAVLPLASISFAGQARPAQVKTAPARGFTPAKTPWGDPDLQGTYTSDDCIGTPMQRPVNLGEKLYFTEEELAQREATIARQAANDKQEFVAPNAPVSVNPPGHWGERARRPCKQTSLIIDPPNGQTPALTPEAQAARGRGGQRGGGGDAIAAAPAPAPQGRGAGGARGGGGGNNNVIY